MKGIHLHASPAGQVCEHKQIRIVRGFLFHPIQTLPPFRVVPGHGADEHELHCGKVLFDQAIGMHHAERILPRIKARDLQKQRPDRIHTGIRNDAAAQIGRQLHVLGRQRIDGGAMHLDASCGSTNWSIVNTTASYSSKKGRNKWPTSLSGAELSM